MPYNNSMRRKEETKKLVVFVEKKKKKSRAQLRHKLYGLAHLDNRGKTDGKHVVVGTSSLHFPSSYKSTLAFRWLGKDDDAK